MRVTAAGAIIQTNKEEAKQKQELIRNVVPDTIEEEEDEYELAEKFAKTELYKEKCIIYHQAIFQIDLSLTSFVSFAPPIIEEAKQESLLVVTEDKEIKVT